MRVLASLLVVAAFVVGVVSFQVKERAPEGGIAADTLERAFAPGGQIRMDLSAGQYRIEGSPDEKIRMHWSTGDSHRRRVDVTADVRGNEAKLTADGPSRRLRVRIEVPSRSDVEIRMTAGELAVRGIEGNKDVELHAGELDLDVGRAEDYERVHATVWAGDLHARPFQVVKEGLFRSFHWEGRGKYQLRAHIKAGELRMSSSSPVTAK